MLKRAITVAFAAVALTGCTLVGTGLGASIPHYESRDWQREEIPLGTTVRVRVRSVGGDSTNADVVGRYGGVRDGLLTITDSDEREHAVPVSDIVSVDVKSGTEWKKGLLLGAAADAVIVTVAVLATNGMNVSVSTSGR